MRGTACPTAQPCCNSKRYGGADKRMLTGPRCWPAELLTLLRVVGDFWRGMRILHGLGPCITVFGSARVLEGDPYYELARRLGAALARRSLTIMTGGGPGLMEAANRSAREVGGFSVGCNIESPFEQRPNPFLDRHVTMHYFFVRKVLLMKYSTAFVVLPGGAGTMNEFFEAFTLVQTGKTGPFPIVLLGGEYWRELIQLLSKMAGRGMIDTNDLELIQVAETVEEAVGYLDDCAVSRCGANAPPNGTHPGHMEDVPRCPCVGKPSFVPSSTNTPYPTTEVR